MKHIFFIFCISIFFTTSVDAQNRRGKMQDRIESQRIAFLTEKLDLTPEESQNFWPLYNEYSAKMRVLKRENRMTNSNLANLNDEEALAAMNKHLETEQNIIDLKRNYFQQFGTAISPSKIVRIFPAEEAFRREILKKLRNRG